MAKDVIIALDFENKEKTLAFLDQFTGRKPFVKIGMELFYAEGPDIVREIKARGHKIFLDLKLHDIPNTVKKAMKVLSKLDVDMTNLHAAGTIAMMEAAKEGLTKEDGSCGVLLAVTQLTSTSEERMQQELLINATMPETVKKYAQNAKAAGLRRGDSTATISISYKRNPSLLAQEFLHTPLICRHRIRRRRNRPPDHNVVAAAQPRLCRGHHAHLIPHVAVGKANARRHRQEILPAGFLHQGSFQRRADHAAQSRRFRVLSKRR